MLGNWLIIFGAIMSNIIAFGFVTPFLISAKDSTLVLLGFAIVVVQLFCDFIFGANFVKAVKEVYEKYVG